MKNKIVSLKSDENISLEIWRKKLLKDIPNHGQVELSMPKASFTFTRAFLTIFNIIAAERNCQTKFSEEQNFSNKLLLPKYYSEPNITQPKTFELNKTK